MNKKQLIESLKHSGFPDNIIKAFEKIKRENFIPKEYKESAYEDAPLPIGQGATISQPYTIAFMLDLLDLQKNQKILEIGSGSGYVLALLEEITKGEIHGVEIIPEIAKQSQKLLKKNPNITIYNKNGKTGLSKYAPYDRILISAACKDLPTHLVEQLKDKGIIVASVRSSIYQIKKQDGKIDIKEYPGFVFVPLVDE